jgi:hypothetical protein
MHTGFWWESQKERDLYEAQCISGSIILKWNLGRENRLVCTGLVWLRIGTSWGVLWTR